jgi:adhesin/invasin
VNCKLSKTLLLTPLVLATTIAFANWGSDSEEINSNNATTNDEGRAAFIDLSKMVAAGDVEGLEDQAITAATDQGVGFTQSFLEKYFPTVEVSFEGKNSEVTSGILVVAPLSDKEDIQNTIFTQLSAFYVDSRTTLNAGLGYRRLEFDNTLMLGVNAFYDHEFPYDHGRFSIGFEARTTVGEVNANIYIANTEWRKGEDGNQERALDGWDVEAGLPLPYMNWATVFLKRYEWDAYDGVADAKGNDVQLRAYIPVIPGLEIQAGRTFKDSLSDENYMSLTYNVTEAFSKRDKPLEQNWISNTAYKLASMESRRYEKVRRENIIVKQIGGGKLSVKGY